MKKFYIFEFSFDALFKISVLLILVVFCCFKYLELNKYTVERLVDSLDHASYSSFVMTNAFGSKICLFYKNDQVLNNKYVFCDPIKTSYGIGINNSLKDSIVKMYEEGKI